MVFSGFNGFLTIFSASTTKKKPAAGEKFVGSLFSKILRFLEKNVEKVTVFSVSTTEKARRRRKIWEPLFLRAGGAPKIFRGLFHFRPRTPLKKFGDDV